jgi:hypothetical protein
VCRLNKHITSSPGTPKTQVGLDELAGTHQLVIPCRPKKEGIRRFEFPPQETTRSLISSDHTGFDGDSNTIVLPAAESPQILGRMRGRGVSTTSTSRKYHHTRRVYTTKSDPILQARRLLESCTLRHDVCNQSLDSSGATTYESLPQRLLDLSRGPHIFVLDIDQFVLEGTATVDSLSRCCTLSYRWGAAAHDCMLKAPFFRETCLSFESMPQTFKDAIITTRGLDIRYLWTDALCVVQPGTY